METNNKKYFDLKLLESSCRDSALYSWSNNMEYCKEFAQVIYLCPTNICNHDCVTCGHSSMRKGKKENGSSERGYMDFDLFKKIVDQLPGGKRRLYLQKTGESLLHPKIADMMRYIKQKRPDYELAMHTNASVLNENLGNEIINYIDFLSFSVFAFDNENYSLAHGRDHYDKVIGNIKKFRQQYLKSKRKIKIYFDVVRNKYNKDLSNSEIFKTLDKEFPEFNVGIHFPFNFQGFVKEYDNKIFENLEKSLFPTCIHPWDMISILWDGQVGYCVGDPLEKGILGDVKNETITQIWNNKNYQNFRKHILSCEWEKLAKMNIHCGSCNWMFALKSQSTGNICLTAKKTIPEGSYGLNTNLIFKSEDLLRAGFREYLRGETSKALEYFSQAKVFNQDGNTTNKADEWVNNVIKIYNKRKNIESWEKALNKEGLSLDSIHISYYKISSHQAEKTGIQHKKLSSGEYVKDENC